MSQDPDGSAISYKVLQRGTVVRAADGVEVGKVHRVLEITRENMLDGIEVDTDQGRRFVDAPEVERIAERAVTLSIDSAAVARLPEPRSRIGEAVEMATPVRRLKRFGRDLRRRWDQR